jgi:ADP-ribosyl-[dinitrogen reductase] hydrolase
VLVSDPTSEFQAAAGPRLGSDLQRRALGAYLGLAVGDALGATVEFLTPGEIRQTYGEHQELVGGGWLRLRPGQVTDDTEMSLVLGRTILAQRRVDPAAVAKGFSEWMRGRPVDIGNTVRRGIAFYRRTGQTQVPEHEHDAGNGACMRCLPVALFTLGAPPETVSAATVAQSYVTHHSALADAGTLTVVRMVQSALLGGTKAELKGLTMALVAAEPKYGYDRRREENPSAYVVETLRAVFQALFATPDLAAALIDVVNRGGDADTTGAILGMITGALYGVEAIPRRWLRALDRSVMRECIEQATRLVALSPHYRGGR